MTDYHGVLNDGLTAESHTVRVRFTADAVVITRDDGSTVRWPVGGVVRLDAPAGILRLRHQGEETQDPTAEQRGDQGEEHQAGLTALARLTIKDPDGLALRRLKQLHPRALLGLRGGRPILIGAVLAAIVAPILVLVAGIYLFAGPIARRVPPDFERGLGRTYYNSVTQFWPVCEAAQTGEARSGLDAMTARLAKPATDLSFDLVVEIVDADFPNAFALPGGYVLVTDELLLLMDTPDQLAGVLAHEIAHVARRHGMVAMVRQMGLAMVADIIISGGAGVAQQIVVSTLDLTAFAHSRRAEAEADDLAITYLSKAGIDPEGLAQFFDAIHALAHDHDHDHDGSASPQADEASQFNEDAGEWVKQLTSTHPETQSRAKAVRKRLIEVAGAQHTPSISDSQWRALQSACPGSGKWRDEMK